VCFLPLSCMPRRARVVFPGVAHHITQRGNNREPVFRSSDDRHFYLSKSSDRRGVVHFLKRTDGVTGGRPHNCAIQACFGDGPPNPEMQHH